MKTIQRKISLEPMTSRLPGVWPSYKDDTLYFFDDKSVRGRELAYPTNYGMVPLSVAFRGRTLSEAADNGFQFCDGTEGDKKVILSYYMVDKWYSFFISYNSLLNEKCHCRTYTSATEYYMFESAGQYASQMEYGQDENTYVELDRKYEEGGGERFYKWICEHVVPTFEIERKYSDYWNTRRLYYSDVIRWVQWLSERADYEVMYGFGVTEDGHEYWKCDVDDGKCCDCEEYFNRGGARTLSAMSEWYERVQEGIMTPSAFTECRWLEPFMETDICLLNSADDFGQFSSLVSEYEVGVDYRTMGGYGATENTKGGTVVMKDGKPLILKDGKTGFKFNQVFMESEYDDGAWDDYTMRYIRDNTSDFVSSAYTLYAFDDEGRRYVGNTEEEIVNAMSAVTVCPITWVDGVVIGSKFYPMEESEYGTYDVNGKLYFVYREDVTNTPYTLINGKKVYAEVYPNEVDGHPYCYYFTFFKSGAYSVTLGCDSVISTSFNIRNYKLFFKEKGDTIRYIMCNGSVIRMEEPTGEIDGNEYFSVSGHATGVSGETMYIKADGSVVSLWRVAEYLSVENAKVDGDNVCIGISHKPTIYSAKEITGHTLSRLTDLASTNKLTDDVGNEIDGIYTPPKKGFMNFQPPMGTVLDLTYQVGNVANLRRLGDDAEGKLLVGDIIEGMEFFYLDSSDTKVCVTKWDGSSLSSIVKSSNEASELISGGDLTIVYNEGEILCDVHYRIGATLERTSAGYSVPNGYNGGIEYWETVKFVKEPVEYYLKKPVKKQIPSLKHSVSAHSVSYPVYVYRLEQGVSDVDLDTNGQSAELPIARFRAEINLVGEGLSSNFGRYEDMDAYNGISAHPVFRREYMMGNATMENVTSDIYIERGINACFEKHLKLGEVTSLDALTQFGLGFFRIDN